MSTNISIPLLEFSSQYFCEINWDEIGNSKHQRDLRNQKEFWLNLLFTQLSFHIYIYTSKGPALWAGFTNYFRWQVTFVSIQNFIFLILTYIYFPFLFYSLIACTHNAHFNHFIFLHFTLFPHISLHMQKFHRNSNHASDSRAIFPFPIPFKSKSFSFQFLLHFFFTKSEGANPSLP